jgi:hypothetical protein
MTLLLRQRDLKRKLATMSKTNQTGITAYQACQKPGARRPKSRHLGMTTKLAPSRGGKLERAATATGTDGEQKLQNNQTVPDAAWDK